MKKAIFIAIFLLTAFTIKAQEAQNIADLDFLYQSIQKLPSYKDQLKDDKSYRELYKKLRKDLNTEDDFEVYQKLLKLIYPIKDNHLGFYRKPDSTYKFKYLRSALSPQELETKYKAYPKDSLEGFYYNAKKTQRYVAVKQSQGRYYLQNLSTGLVEVILNQSQNGSMDAIFFRNPPVPYVLIRNVRFSSGNLIGLNFQKDANIDFSLLDPGSSLYEYKILDSTIGYLRLSSFSSSNQNIKIATDFFNRVKPDINAPKLIVDLRNNGGGGYKTSGQFISFLKKYKGKIYVLQNGYTMSNAEQFIIDLQGANNFITLGERTKGTITYGSNYGKTLGLPSNRFLFYPTDISGRSKDLAYESIGIKPDVTLDPVSEDWITQTIKYIQNN
jgi:hypothetical protein